MSICPHCGEAFTCGMADPTDDQPCWCMAFPIWSLEKLKTADGTNDATRCYCPTCLKLAMEQTDAPPK